MDSETILVSAGLGIVTSAVTAYITTLLRMSEERKKWQREFSIKYLEAQAVGNEVAHKMAMQFGIGFLKFRNSEMEPQKVFVPPNCRLVVGRGPDSSIHINDRQLSRYHCAFVADDANVYIETLAATIPTLLNGNAVRGKCKLKTGDIVEIGKTEFVFYKL